MKMCPKCNEEFAQYVELCPNCGRMLKTIRQQQKKEPTVYIDPNKIGNQQKLVLREKQQNNNSFQNSLNDNLNQNSFERDFDNLDEMSPFMEAPKKQNKIILIIGIVATILVIGIGGIILVNVTSSEPQEPIITNVPHQEFEFSYDLGL